MSSDETVIDGLLAAALRGESVFFPTALAELGHSEAVIARINYHGVAGLLCHDSGVMTGWPSEVTTHIRHTAVAQTMWELRHRDLLRILLGQMAGADIPAIVLKGTATAYDLYASPAMRARGDSDLLVDPGDLDRARQILAQYGYERSDSEDAASNEFSLQEVWSRTCDADMDHHIDLHWQLLNSPALARHFPFAECAREKLALPHLGPHAWAMDRVRTLLHTCIHRAINFSSPYFVDGRTYYGGDRLIWLNDIRLLARSFSPAQWTAFCHLAGALGYAAVCLDGLGASRRSLGTPVPASVHATLLRSGSAHGPAAYLRSRQLGRAWRDLLSVPGLRSKLAYLRFRSLPSRSFMYDKYPRLAGLPLPLLYARRLADLVRARPTHSAGR